MNPCVWRPTFEAVRLDHRNQSRGLAFQRSGQPETSGCILERRFKQFFALLNRQSDQVAASEIEQIKGVKVGVIGSATAMGMLKFLKRRTPLVIQRHNFAVENELLGLELPQTFDHGWK